MKALPRNARLIFGSLDKTTWLWERRNCLHKNCSYPGCWWWSKAALALSPGTAGAVQTELTMGESLGESVDPTTSCVVLGAALGHLLEPWWKWQSQTSILTLRPAESNCTLARFPSGYYVYQSLISTGLAKLAGCFLSPHVVFVLFLILTTIHLGRIRERTADLPPSFLLFKEKELNWVIKSLEEE